MKFYNREEELNRLKKTELLSRESAQMTVITGRRRVGKTELVKRFLEEHPEGIYLFVERKRPNVLLEEYTAILTERFPMLVSPLRNFSEFFKFIFEIAKQQNLTIIFDEFQNFKFVDPAVFSTLQNYWDGQKKKTKINLILVGSVLTLMEKIFSGNKEPLFGRATQKIYLAPFSTKTVKQILKDYHFEGFEDILNFYTIFGGIPKYYECLESEYRLHKISFFEIIKSLFLDKDAILKKEGFDFLVEEFGKKYQTYFSLLQIISEGASKMSEISSKTGIPITAISRSLEGLVNNFKILERRQPVFSKISKQGRYYLNDNFLTFWFRYIFRFRSLLEIGKENKILEFIKKDIKNLQGFIFEKIVHEIILEKENRGEFVFEIDGIGKFWDRIGHEIDIVAYNENDKKIFFGECKLSASSINFSLFSNLKSKASYVSWFKGSRKEFYGIVTIGKINPLVKKELERENVFIMEL